MKNITQEELPKILQQDDSILLDVREISEFRDFNIGGINIPPHEITEKIPFLESFKIIVVACSNGTRSGIVARLLSKKLPNVQLYHLEEGVF